MFSKKKIKNKNKGLHLTKLKNCNEAQVLGKLDL